MRSSVLYILPFAFIALFLGLLSGLVRLGMPLPFVSVGQHGVFMVGGFLGTLISIERIVSFKSNWLYGIPLFFGIGTIFLLFNLSELGYSMYIWGSLLYLIISIIHYKNHKTEGDFFLLCGAFFQILGHGVLLITYSYPMALAAWLLFFLMTIIGERLELTRYLPVKKSVRFELYLWMSLLVISSVFYHSGGKNLVSFSFLALGQWLIRNDISIINISKTGHYRFLGASLMLGFIWLFVTGIISFLPTNTPNKYDAFVHSFFIGFVLNMILAHAPIIFPAFLKISTKPYHKGFYVGLLLLNSALLVRLIGDFTSNILLRQLSGMVLALAFLGHLISIMAMTFRAHFKEISKSSPKPPSPIYQHELQF